MKYLFLILLGGFFGVHLFHSWKDERKKRAITKPFLLLCIIGYYLFSVDKPNPVLIAALITSWVGDILLIPKSTGFFAAGGISFLASHICFIFVYLPQMATERVNWLIIALAACAYAGVIVWLFKTLWPHGDNKPLFVAMCFYIIANATMNIFALIQLFSVPCAGSVVAYIGAVLFFASDTSLFLCDFHPNRDFVFKRHFTVMLTYVLGELLITHGMIMLA